MRHENPLLNLEELPRSTYYYWREKLNHLYTLCVWAGWRKAKQADSIPTFDAIWGTAEFSAFVYRNRRTNEIRVATSSPGEDWLSNGVFVPSTKEVTEKLLSGINMTGWAVEHVLDEHLSKSDRKTILELLPVCGKYQGSYWDEANPNKYVSGDPKKRGEIAGDDQVHSLRDMKPSALSDSETMTLRLASGVLVNNSIRLGVKALEEHAAIIPRAHRPQQELSFSNS
jgi:hypothetical protein